MKKKCIFPKKYLLGNEKMSELCLFSHNSEIKVIILTFSNQIRSNQLYLQSTLKTAIAEQSAVNSLDKINKDNKKNNTNKQQQNRTTEQIVQYNQKLKTAAQAGSKAKENKCVFKKDLKMDSEAAWRM